MTPPEGTAYLRSTLAYCDRCAVTELARITATPDGVFMERLCPNHGVERVRIAKSSEWYMQRLAAPRRVHETGEPFPMRNGCPSDCGPCAWHTGGIHLPVFSITNDCNLDCPICFTYNRPDRKYYKTIAETERIIDRILERTGKIQLINITGGEPTLHPGLFEILDSCRRPGIGRITMNTNGIRIAEDGDFARRIADAGVQLVLSLHTLDPRKSLIIHGKDITGLKLACLARLEELRIPTTILPVCINGVNEDDVAGIVHEYLRRPFVRSITVQNMTYTGKNGNCFEPRGHITMDEVEELLATREGIEREDFFPLSSYHPLCYSAAYYIVRNGRLISLTRLLERGLIGEMSANGYILTPSRDLSAEFRDGVSRLWAEGADETEIAIIREFLAALYPHDRALTEPERLQTLEEWMKMLLVHPHMDRDNFDIDRVSACGDMVPDESGRMIPACSYNLLYRQQDPRFWVEPA